MAYLSGLAKAVLTADSSNAANSAADVPAISTNIPAGVLVPGSCFQVRASGLVSNALLSSTFNFWIKLGTTKIGIANMTTPLLGQTNIPWRVEGLLTVRANGASGSLVGSLLAESPAGSSTLVLTDIPATAINTAQSNVLAFGFNWTTANAINIITARQAILAAL